MQDTVLLPSMCGPSLPAVVGSTGVAAVVDVAVSLTAFQKSCTILLDDEFGCRGDSTLLERIGSVLKDGSAVLRSIGLTSSACEQAVAALQTVVEICCVRCLKHARGAVAKLVACHGALRAVASQLSGAPLPPTHLMASIVRRGVAVSGILAVNDGVEDGEMVRSAAVGAGVDFGLECGAMWSDAGLLDRPWSKAARRWFHAALAHVQLLTMAAAADCSLPLSTGAVLSPVTYVRYVVRMRSV